MPLQKGNSPKIISKNISEFHTGPRFAHTAAKFGKKDADRQAVAVAMNQAKGRALGGVAPMLSQAMQSTMPSRANIAPTMPDPSAPVPMPMNSSAPASGIAGSIPTPVQADPSTNPAVPTPVTMPAAPSTAPTIGANPAVPTTAPMPPIQTAGFGALQTPASGVAPAPAFGQAVGLNAGMPGPAGSRGFAFGGGVSAQPKTFHGPIVSAVPGRTDKHFTHVPSGSFVIPADIVSGHGQGNTLAGMNTLQKLFRMGPHTTVPKIGSVKAPKYGRGGSADNVGTPTKVVLAGGEIVIPPENAHETMERVAGKKLTLDQAHAALDAWVLKHRKKLIKTLKKLPPPARD